MAGDIMRAAHSASVGGGISARDSMLWRPVLKVEKYHGDDLTAAPYEVLERAGNLLTTAGLTRITSLITAGGGQGAASEIERRIKDICDKALGREIGVGDNLFEIGASSLKLIEIHEQLDELYPNQVELTELLDYPTIAELAAHLEAKLAENR